MTEAVNPVVVVEPVVELTRAEKLDVQIAAERKKIDNATAKFHELIALRNSIDLLAGVDEGSVVTVKVGRAETAKTVNATVVGVKSDESGAVKYKVYFGQGFDAETVVINEGQIIAVVSNPDGSHLLAAE